MSGKKERDNIMVFDGKKRGHYEVYYMKFNAPPYAFWIRYTVLSPIAGGSEPVGELWAIAFNKDKPEWNDAWKRTVPFSQCSTLGQPFAYRIGTAELSHHGSRGEIARDDDRNISWDLAFHEEGETFHHFPGSLLYRLPFPKTKVVAPHLSMRVSGSVTVGNQTIALDKVPGHQAHIWGTKHALRWAWANCNQFEEAEGVVFEALSARIKLGKVETPDLSIAALRLPGKEILFNRVDRWLKNSSHYELEFWRLEASQGEHRLEAEIKNRVEDMVGVAYQDPDGEPRVCHNSKVADLDLGLYRKTGSEYRLEGTFRARGTAAFEVVTPEADPRVVVKI